MSEQVERKHELVYVIVQRDLNESGAIVCAVFHDKDKDEAYKTVDYYNENEGEDSPLIFEVQVTALFE